MPHLAHLAFRRHLLLDTLLPPTWPCYTRACMLLPPGVLAGLRTILLPKWAMLFRQLLQWHQVPQVRWGVGRRVCVDHYSNNVVKSIKSVDGKS